MILTLVISIFCLLRLVVVVFSMELILIPSGQNVFAFINGCKYIIYMYDWRVSEVR